MKFRLFFLIGFFLLSSLQMISQERKDRHGKVVGKMQDLKGIIVLNSNSSKSVLTENGGYFKLPMAINDTLIIRSEFIKEKVFVVRYSDFAQRTIQIPIEADDNVLEELVIDKSSDAYYRHQSKYKGLEKDLYTATSAGPLGKLINLLSGRTKMLKKAVAYQHENDLAEKMISAVNESYFVDDLKIPKESINGFGYYILNDLDVVRAIEDKNTLQLQFLLPTKAKMYLETLKVIKQ